MKPFVQNFFSATKKDRNDKLQTEINKWKADSDDSFDGFWERFKKEYDDQTGELSSSYK